MSRIFKKFLSNFFIKFSLRHLALRLCQKWERKTERGNFAEQKKSVKKQDAICLRWKEVHVAEGKLRKFQMFI